jgi:hypothetical protein
MGGGASKSRAGKPTKERGSGGAEKKRLVLYSEHAAELPAFVEALRANAMRVVSSPYSFEAASADSLRQQVAKLAKQHGRFLSIALCPLGPNRAPGTYDEAEMEDCHWELSAQLVLKQASGLLRVDNPCRQVLEALGKATVDGGRVDLLSCGLIGTWACPESAFPSLMPLAPICESAGCCFTASKHMLTGNPIESEDEWPMDSDVTVDVRATYFLPPAGEPSRFRVSELQRRYALGDELGRGAYAVVRRAVRRQEVGHEADLLELDGSGSTSAAQQPAAAVSVNAHGASYDDGPKGMLKRSQTQLALLRRPQPLAVKGIDVSKVESLDEIEAEIAIMKMLKHKHIIR